MTPLTKWLEKMNFIMVSAPIKYLILKVVLVTALCAFYNSSSAQNAGHESDFTFTNLLDKGLLPVKLKDDSKPILVVSDISCIACVKYFTTFKTSRYSVLFILQHESLLDVKRLLALYEVKTKDVYFTTCAEIKTDKKEICKSNSPFMITKTNGRTTLLPYAVLDSITGSFSDKKRRFLNAYH